MLHATSDADRYGVILALESRLQRETPRALLLDPTLPNFSRNIEKPTSYGRIAMGKIGALHRRTPRALSPEHDFELENRSAHRYARLGRLRKWRWTESRAYDDVFEPEGWEGVSRAFGHPAAAFEITGIGLSVDRLSAAVGVLKISGNSVADWGDVLLLTRRRVLEPWKIAGRSRVYGLGKP